ncbi:hypothetical protein ACFQ9Z_20770 [Streptomyces sp. NPDC056580]|uniref:hypothetical protein n=1 Tax=Streptomyces sp. NPDC056580 TaxID=3345872 RepID=UPI0036A8A7DD
MGLGDIKYEDVIAATEEFRRMGRDNFLQTYGFGRATSYELVLGGLRYDSKAIAGVAHGHATGDFLSPGDFSGGAATVARRLRDLGFVVETGETPWNRAALLGRLRKLKVSRGPGAPAPSRHQPLSLLWAISREAGERPRMTPWSQFRDEVGPLLLEFGLPNAKATPAYPFWHLRGSGLCVGGSPKGVEQRVRTPRGPGLMRADDFDAFFEERRKVLQEHIAAAMGKPVVGRPYPRPAA